MAKNKQIALSLAAAQAIDECDKKGKKKKQKNKKKGK